MSISNDHYYGHVSRYIVENNVTWLECAACCTVWSAMLVYYLEAPYGNRQTGSQNAGEGQPLQLLHALGRHREVLSRSFSACR